MAICGCFAGIYFYVNIVDACDEINITCVSFYGFPYGSTSTALGN